MNDTFRVVRFGLDKYTNPYITLFKMSLWGFLFGVLLEWRGLKNILSGKIQIDFLLIPAIIFMIIGFIPIIKWGIWFGVANSFYIEMFMLPEINVVITILCGVLLVRSIAEK